MRAYLMCGIGLAAIGTAASAQTADTTCSQHLLTFDCRTRYQPATPTYNVWDGLRDLGNAMQRERRIEAIERETAEIEALRAELAQQRATQNAERTRVRSEIIASAEQAVSFAVQDGRCDDVSQLNEAFRNSLVPKFCALGRPKTSPVAERAETLPASRVLIKWGLDAYHGNGVAQDQVLAATYFRLAANQGNAKGQYNLAMMYGKGEGVMRNEAEAWRLIRLSAAQGFPAAQQALALAPKAPAKRKKLASRAR